MILNSQRSGRCCDGFTWDETAHTCIACPDGFIGKTCEEACIYPNYGKECQLLCNCSEEFCNITYGCVKASPVVSYPDKNHGTTDQHLPLTAVNVDAQRNETNIPDTKTNVSYYNHLNVTEYVIQTSIFVLFGIAVVLLMAIFYVYIRQKMYIQLHEASSS